MSHTGRSYTPTRRAGEGHWGRRPNRSSSLDALALLPYFLTLMYEEGPCDLKKIITLLRARLILRIFWNELLKIYVIG